MSDYTDEVKARLEVDAEEMMKEFRSAGSKRQGADIRAALGEIERLRADAVLLESLQKATERERDEARAALRGGGEVHDPDRCPACGAIRAALGLRGGGE